MSLLWNRESTVDSLMANGETKFHATLRRVCIVVAIAFAVVTTMMFLDSLNDVSAVPVSAETSHGAVIIP